MRKSEKEIIVHAHFEQLASEYDYWKERAHYYYSSLKKIYQNFIPAGSRVLEIGCGTGEILSSVGPKHGVGIDISEGMIARAKQKFPQLTFFVDDAQEIKRVRGTFDYVVMSDLIEHVYDVQTILEEARRFLKPQGSLVLTSINPLWSPIFDLAERFHLKAAEGPHKWLSAPQLKN